MSKKYNDFAKECLKNFSENKGHAFKILLNFYKGEVWTLIKSVFVLIIQNSPTLIIPFITTNIINEITNPRENSLTVILINAAVGFVSLIQNSFSTYLVSRIYDKLVRKIEYGLRSCIVDKVQHLSIMFHKNISSGKLQSKIMRDCENIETILASAFRNIVSVILYLVVAITVTIKKSPVVMTFFVIIIPIELFLLRFLGGTVKKRNRTFRNEIEKTQSNVSEMIDLIPVTRAHGLQHREVKNMNFHFDNVMNTGYKLDKINSFFLASSWMLSELARLGCLVFTGILAFKGKISVGEVVLYQTYFGQILGSLNTLLNMYPQISKGMESINSIGEILNEEKVEIDNSIITADNIRGRVDFMDVCYKYEDSDKWVIDGLNLSVKEGESIAFVGGSGAGKSTIINLLIGFDRPQEGNILIDGINMMNLDMTSFRKQIAVVPQNTILFSGSIKDNISYGLDSVTDEQIYEVIKAVGLDDLISEMPNGIDTQLGEHGGKLSGGQRQRISIARALLRNPKIIIFDEATSALDSASEKKVQKAVDNMMKKCTTFLIAHRLSTIKNADRIAVVSRGKIVEIGSHDELMAKKGAFYELKKLQE